jgi:hypothetical protein
MTTLAMEQFDAMFVVENAKSTNSCFAKPSRSWKPQVLLKSTYIEIWIDTKV